MPNFIKELFFLKPVKVIIGKYFFKANLQAFIMFFDSPLEDIKIIKSPFSP